MQLETPVRTSGIELVDLARQPYVAVRATVGMGEVPARIAALFEQLFGWLAQHQVPPMGEPWARYLAVGTEEIEVEAAAPVAAPVATDGSVISGVRPACTALRMLHIGPYEGLMEAYDALQNEVSAGGFALSGAIWEAHETDPSFEPNPAKWRTWVYYPV